MIKKIAKIVKDYIKDFIKDFIKESKIMFKEFFKKETNKKQRANMWSFMRFVSGIAIIIPTIIAHITGTLLPILACLGVAGFGAITDALDGPSARKHGSVSESGKKLDQVADKFFSGLIGLSVISFNPLYIINLALEGIIGGINVNYSVKYPKISDDSSMVGKIKTWVLSISLIFGYISTINPATMIASMGLITATSAFQITTAKKYYQSKRTEKLIVGYKDNTNITNNEELNVINTKKLEKQINYNPSQNIEKINNQKHRQLLLKQLKATKNELLYKDTPQIKYTENNNKQYVKKNY